MSVVPATLQQVRPGESVPAVDQPLISVVTPSYNQGPFIERCIRSVLDQGYENFEHIVFDNCSTDETRDVLVRYPHVKWCSEPDRGQSDALNKAISHAQGEIIAWINADDYYKPGAFALAARELHRDSGVYAIAGRVELVDPAGVLQTTTTPHFEGHDYLADFWSHHYGLCQPGVLFRREVLGRVGLLRVDLHYAMDYDFWLRLAQHYDIRVVDDVVAGYIVHPASKTGSALYGTGFVEEMAAVAREHWGPWWSRRYRQYARACNRYRCDMLAITVVGAHKRDVFDWRHVWRLARRWPWALWRPNVRAVVIERLLGPRLFDLARRASGGRGTG